MNLNRAGRTHEALAAVQEAVTIYRSLVQIDPAAYKPALAASLHNVARAWLTRDIVGRSGGDP